MAEAAASRFEDYESIYWVFTQLCNDRCDHCYNDSGPRGRRIGLDECLAVVGNLPQRLGRLILSGGEPLVEEAKLHAILEAVAEKYRGAAQVMLQTNGDLLDGGRLDALLERGVTRLDVASMDRFHKHKGQRRAELEALFRSRGMSGDDPEPLIRKDNFLKREAASYGFWGANEEMWLGGNWARGQALRTGVWLRDGDHNFCAILSGARGFLGGSELPQELSIQLYDVNPCCPGTRYPIGDARRERISAILERVAGLPVFQRLNQGDPYGMGESLGVTSAYGRERARALQSVCRWCDEFMGRYLDAKTLSPAGQPSPSPGAPLAGGPGASTDAPR